MTALATDLGTDSLAPPHGLSLIEELLRDAGRFLSRLEELDLIRLVQVLVATVIIGAGAFGAVIGAFRGGIQILYCAIKLPLVLLGTLVVCTPPFVAIARATGSRLSARGVIALTLAGCARFALILAGLAPVVWLLHGWQGYHRIILIVVGACGVAGISAALLLFRGLAAAGGAKRLAGMAFVLVFSVVGVQTSWLLRPFIVRPKTVSIPFVRGLEGDFLQSVQTTTNSARGIYRGPARPCGGGRCD